MTVNLDSMSPENLATLFTDSVRITSLVESSRKLKEYQEGKQLITGVFQGGGAKGVAYVGVLEELEREGIWFRKVAGTSAGAITAVFNCGWVHSE